MKTAKLTLHDGREVVVNLDKFVHAMITQDEESGEEYCRITQEDGQVLDITGSLAEFEKIVKK